MKQLRGKVKFDYKLNRNLTPGQKSAITRAINQLPEDQTARFIAPKKKRGESGTAFAKRLNTIKRNEGQEKTRFLGVFVKAPPGAKASFKNDRVNLSVPSQNYSETHTDINNVAIADGRRRKKYLRETLASFEAQGFTGVSFRMGTGRTIEFEIDEIELMDEMLGGWMNQYGKQFSKNLFENVLNGMILTVRP